MRGHAGSGPSDLGPADFVSIGNAPCSILVVIVRKFILLIPLICIMPHILSDRARAVFMAEPVADVAAAVFTVILFSRQFKKALKKLEDQTGEPAPVQKEEAEGFGK